MASAISKLSYSPKEFQFLIAEQDAFGTLEASGGNSYTALDVDSVGSPSLGVTQVLENRAGTRVLQATDFFQDVKGSIKEFSVSGTATLQSLDLLLSHILEEAQADGVYAFLSNDPTSSVGTGDSSQADTLFSIVYKSAKANADFSFKDCVCTSLTLSGDSGTEGGRIKFSATFKSGSVVEDLSDDTTAVDQAITAANYYTSTWVSQYVKIVDLDWLLLHSFSLTITNDVAFSGLATTGYQVVTRAGEFSATLDATVKFDANTESFFALFNAQTTGASQGVTLLNDGDTLTNGTFGINMPKSILTNVAFNDGDVMLIDVSVKALGNSNDSLIEVAC